MERVVPSDSYWYFNHLARYRFALFYTGGKSVLDVGCGEGYGAKELSGCARSVIGVDVDETVVRRAQTKYRGSNLNFAVMDCRDLSFPDGLFDVVVGFELFEHLERAGEMLVELRRVLAVEGVLLLSTPNKEVYPQAGVNPFHVKEYSLGEFRRALEEVFGNVEMYGQTCRLAARKLYQHPAARFVYRVKRLLRLPRLLPMWLRSAVERVITGKTIQEAKVEDFEISQQRVEEAEVFIAVCRP